MTGTIVQKYINALYVVMYDRTADSNGYNYWLSTVAGATAQTPVTDTIAQTMAGAFRTASPTYFNTQYNALSDTNFILALYANLGNTSSGVGGDALNYWQGRLDSFGGDRAKLAGDFTKAFLEYNGTDAAGLLRKAAFENKVAVSQAWVDASRTNAFMNSAAPTDAAFAAQMRIIDGVDHTTAALQLVLAQVNSVVSTTNLAAAVGIDTGALNGQTYALTTSTVTGAFDALVGTAANDTFNAGPGTAETGDTVNGGAGTDVLNVRMTAAVTTNPALTSVEKVYARLDGANLASTLQLGGNSGLAEVWADRLEDTDGVGNGTTLTINGISKAVTLGVTGDSVLGTSASRGNVTFVLNDVTGAADAANLAFDGGGKVNTTTIADVETLNISSLGSVSNSSASIVAAAATSVRVSGTQQLSLGASNNVTTATLDIDATKDYSVDASGMSGTFRVVLDDQAATKTVTYRGGSGADRVFLGAGLDALDDIDGGSGTDTIGFTVAADLTSTTGARLKSFEILDVAGSGAQTYDVDLITGGGTSSTIQNISVSAALTGATVVSNLVDTGAVTFTASSGANALTINQKGAGDAGSNADTLTFNISPSSTTGDLTINSLVAANIETVTIRSNANGAYTTGHTVTGTTFANAATVNFTGSEQITVTTLGAAAATLIDASALGDRFIMTNASDAATVLLVKGSAFADTIVMEDTAQLPGSVVQGNGGADIINLDNGAASFTVKYTAQADSTYSAFDQITNFNDVAEDLIDLSAFAFAAAARGAVLERTVSATFAGTGAASTFNIANGVNLFEDSGVDRAVATIDNGTDVFVLVDVNKDGDFSTSADLVILLVGNSNVLGTADFVFV